MKSGFYVWCRLRSPPPVLKWDATALYFLKPRYWWAANFSAVQMTSALWLYLCRQLGNKTFNHQLLFLLKSQSVFSSSCFSKERRCHTRRESERQTHTHRHNYTRPISLETKKKKRRKMSYIQRLKIFKLHRLGTSFQKTRRGSFRRKDLWKSWRHLVLAVCGQGFLSWR